LALTTITLPGRQSRARELYEALRDAILDGKLTSGERLVEEQIAAMASVSRTPVREAIRRLEADGLVEDSGSGAVAVTLTPDALAEMCEVREAMEGLVCRLAAIRRSEMALLTLQDLAGRWRTAVEQQASDDELVRLNHAFHETIWRMAGNRYLVDQLRVLRGRIELSGRTTLSSPDRAAEAMSEHAALLEAIAKQDPDAAEELARTHFRRAMALRLASVRSDSFETV
jgi:DNA-binding GntR family transcriptional regulator